MPFRRKDFHGSRTYEADPPASAGSQFGFSISLMIAWVKLQLDKMLLSGVPSSPSGTSLLRGSGGYSLLGTDVSDTPPHPVRTEVFPMNAREPGFQTRLKQGAAREPRRPQSPAR